MLEAKYIKHEIIYWETQQMEKIKPLTLFNLITLQIVNSFLNNSMYIRLNLL